MSGRLMGQVWEIELSAPDQAVMLALADHGSDYPNVWGFGYKIFPSVELLAWKTGKTERQIQRILRKLEISRLIVPVAYSSGGRGHATEYEMHLENGRHKIWPDALKGDIQGQEPEPLKGDIQGQDAKIALKGDIQGLKGDIQGLKGDIQGLKGDIAMSPQPSENHINRQRNHTRTHARKNFGEPEPDAEPEAEADPSPGSASPLPSFSEFQRLYRQKHGLGAKYSTIHRAYNDLLDDHQEASDGNP